MVLGDLKNSDSEIKKKYKIKFWVNLLLLNNTFVTFFEKKKNTLKI